MKHLDTCKRGHNLHNGNVYWDKSYRRCLRCAAEKQRRYRRRYGLNLGTVGRPRKPTIARGALAT